MQMKYHILLLSIYCGVLYFGCVYYSDSTAPPFSFFYNLALTFEKLFATLNLSEKCDLTQFNLTLL